MHSMSGKRGLMAGLVLALAAAIAIPTPATAGPDPAAGSRSRFRLFAGTTGAITINRIYYGLNAQGEVGVDSSNSSTIGGGYWPKGSGNQYMFNSGLQVAGIIGGSKPGNPWAGDTTGGFFFDPKGTTPHGTPVTEVYNATSSVDVANWPDAGLVPQGDDSEELFNPLLRGRVSASQGDVWFVATEADPGLSAGRPHPLGIVAEYRVMGWNYPTGNEDLIYLIITFYNITSLNPADYTHVRPGMREILIEQAQLFHSRNNARFGITLPTEGYTISPMYAAMSSDPDVAASGTNFATVTMPFAMGYTYHADFLRYTGWVFPPNINGAPFFAGVGFVGIKYLKSATGPGEIALFSNTTNGGSFPDPANTTRLYKYMSGEVTPADGVNCNQGVVTETRMCYVNQSVSDVRMIQSSTPFDMGPGASASIVVSYLHAAPVAIESYTQGDRVPPGTGPTDGPRRWLDPEYLEAFGGSILDSLTGFQGFADQNEDGIIQQREVATVTGSLLGKAKLAQDIFDNKFLLPFAPAAPDFFLIPGDGQVTVVWRPSDSETEGDPFYEVAKDAAVVPAGGGEPVQNVLYDANYRKFDVEGYRLYRGRADTPTSLQLVQQWDYSNTRFRDFTGQFLAEARGARCAPELEITASCNNVFDIPGPMVQLTRFVEYDITGVIPQVRGGDRFEMATGDVYNMTVDTAVTGGGTGYPALANTGVPFAYVDDDVINGITYYYALTAFDVNSINSTGSGNTSLESARITKRIVPSRGPGNYVNEAEIQTGIFGRSGLLTDAALPTIDPATGRFSKRFPPTNAVDLSVAAFVKELLAQPGEISIMVDSASLTANIGDNAVFNYHYTITTPSGQTRVSVPATLAGTNAATAASGSFTAIEANSDLAAKYGAPTGSYTIGGGFNLRFPAGYYARISSRGCVNGATGFGPLTTGCYNNGSRWFAGDNETMADPVASNPGRWTTGFARESFNNSGELPGVRTIYQPKSYDDYGTAYRGVEAVFAGLMSAADYNVYWGDGGKVDSVVDLTHDTPVPFKSHVDLSWGILNASAVAAAGSYDQRAQLTVTDIGCVEPIRSRGNAVFGCAAGPVGQLTETAVPGPIAYAATPTAGAGAAGNMALERTAPVAAGQGFLFYIKGNVFLMEMEGGVPASGTVWTLRDYVGAIKGGNGRAGNFGNYSFTVPAAAYRPFTAPGSSAKFAFDLSNEIRPSTASSVASVHTVPDPYYVTSAYEAVTTTKLIKFVNLPSKATIRIYTTSGVLVRVLKHDSAVTGDLTWDVRSRNNHFVASGVYFYHVTAENGETTVGRMTIVNYAQ